jgi:hypothetical protein
MKGIIFLTAKSNSPILSPQSNSLLENNPEQNNFQEGKKRMLFDKH